MQLAQAGEAGRDAARPDAARHQRLQVCEELRRWDAFVPIVMLTARGQEVDKIRGLDAGADDYVTKPFSVGELIARMRAIFRRAAARRRCRARRSSTIGEVQGELDGAHAARGDEDAQLSFYEVELLRLLHERRRSAGVAREILQKIWGLEAAPRTAPSTTSS